MTLPLFLGPSFRTATLLTGLFSILLGWPLAPLLHLGEPLGEPRLAALGGGSKAPAGAPEWFAAGVEAALLVPTAMNQQKFEIELTGTADGEGGPVVALRNGGGAYSKVDLSIVRLHFELGTAAAGGEFSWEGTWR